MNFRIVLSQSCPIFIRGMSDGMRGLLGGGLLGGPTSGDGGILLPFASYFVLTDDDEGHIMKVNFLPS